jgi:hypothetical protein
MMAVRRSLMAILEQTHLTLMAESSVTRYEVNVITNFTCATKNNLNKLKGVH